MVYGAIALTIYFLKAIAVTMSRDLWGDRINNLFSKGDRYYCESLFLGDRTNNLSSKGDRYYYLPLQMRQVRHRIC